MCNTGVGNSGHKGYSIPDLIGIIKLFFDLARSWIGSTKWLKDMGRTVDMGGQQGLRLPQFMLP